VASAERTPDYPYSGSSDPQPLLDDGDRADGRLIIAARALPWSSQASLAGPFFIGQLITGTLVIPKPESNTGQPNKQQM